VENHILRVDKKLERLNAAEKQFEKYHVSIKMAKSMPEALKLLSQAHYDLVLIIADDETYLPYLKIMRDLKPMPILVFSTKYSASEKLEAIRLGADEFLAYPATIDEGIASGMALIRRYTALNYQDERLLTLIIHHDVFVCVEHRKLFIKDKEITLTRREFDLLNLLLSSIGRVYTHEQIYMHVWGDETDDTNIKYAIWCLVARVRKKLRTVPGTFDYIKTVRDVGYCIDALSEKVSK
jgi:DNA-binding response OmpR family regulator